MKLLKKSNIIIFLAIHFLIVLYIRNVLFPIHLAPENFFILDLIGGRAYIPFEVLICFDLGNLILFWLIGKKLFSKYFFLPSLIYAIIPWNSYLVAAQSFYIYLLFGLLVSFYGLLLLKSKKLLGMILLILGVVTLSYDSAILYLLIGPILFLITFFKIIPLNDLKTVLFVLFILTLPLNFMILKNQTAFKNILSSEIRIFSDPGLINMVNNYQGAARQEGFGNLSKISENKYIFTAEYAFYKYIKHFTPATYFTSQEKLLNFSFSPPIYFGFIVPFIYGAYLILNNFFLRKVLFFSTFLIIPSVLAKEAVDLNRLILFAPVVILVISFGIIKLTEHNKKIANFFLLLSLGLVILQFLTTISDIGLRERDRYIKYFGESYQINK